MEPSTPSPTSKLDEANAEEASPNVPDTPTTGIVVGGQGNKPVKPPAPVPEPVDEPAPAPQPPEPPAAPTPPPPSPQPPVNTDIAPAMPPAAAAPAAEPSAPIPADPQVVQALAPKPKRNPKTLLIALLAVLLFGGASAAAYVGLIVPGRPQNVVKTALINTLQAPQTTLKSTIEGTFSGDAESQGAYKVVVNTAQNVDAKTSSIQIEPTISGVTFPIEARLINKDIYVKVGDLSTIAGLVTAYSPDAGKAAQAVSSKLSNQWMVIDSTITKESKELNCVLDTKYRLTDADTKVLGDIYSKHEFATVVGAGSETVNGAKAAKYTVTIDNDKAAAYGNDKGLENLSFVKSLTKCAGSFDQSTAADEIKGNHKKTTLTLWVDKGAKRITKVAYKDKQATATATLSYGNVTISKPKGAKPALQVLGEVQSALTASGVDLTQLFSSFTGGGSPDSVRKTNSAYIAASLDEYGSNHNGVYPTLAQMNDANWRHTNLPGLEDAMVQDPEGTSAAFVALPTPHAFSYSVTNANGASCESAPTSCVKYTVTATLSDGSKYEQSSLSST